MKTFFENTKLTIKNRRTAIIIALIVSTFIGLTMYLNYNRKVENLISLYDTEQEVTIDITNVFIKDKIKNVGSKLMTIYDNELLKNYIEYPENPLNVQALESLFVNYTKNVDSVTQMRIIDEKGMERIRVNRGADRIEVVPESLLQDKSERYYFDNVMALNEKEIYISDFDLNIENGEVVEPYEPTIRFAIKLYDYRSQPKGLLIMNLNGLDFFKVMTEYEDKNHKYSNVGLLDSNNYWTLNQARTNDFSEIFLTVVGKKSGYVSNVLNRIIELDNQSSGIVYSDSIHYGFQLVNLQDNGLKYVFETYDTQWYVFASYDLSLMLERNDFFVDNVIILTIGACFLIAILTYFFMVLFQIKMNDKLLLMVSAYISDNSNEGIVILNAQKNILYSNNVFREIFEYKNTDLINRSIDELFDNNFEVAYDKHKNNILWSGNIWNETKNNHLICKHLTIKVILEKNNNIVYYIGIYSNPLILVESSGEKERSLENIFFSSKSDLNTMGDKINSLYADESYYAILTVQLNGSIQKLFETSQSMQSQFMSLSGQEFPLDDALSFLALPRADYLVYGVKSDENKGVRSLNEKKILMYIKKLEVVFKKIQRELNFQGLDFKFQVGVALHNIHGFSPREVLNKSMIALEALIKFKDSNYLVYDQKYHDYVRQDIDIRENLKGVFQRGELYLNYQPQFKSETNQITGVEALVRWENTTLGVVGPDLFIPLLEKTDDILLLGQNVLKMIIDDFKTISFKTNFRVSFNLSSIEFLNDEVMDSIIELIKVHKTPFLKYCVEITETTLLENLEKANRMIQRLHENDIQVAIDDFGTGYSSLGYLKTLLADEIKIDRMFIMDYPESDDGKILKAIINIGKELTLDVIVEGVEIKEQLDLLKVLNCPYYQGYYGSKPLSFQALKVILLDHFKSDELG